MRAAGASLAEGTSTPFSSARRGGLRPSTLSRSRSGRRRGPRLAVQVAATIAISWTTSPPSCSHASAARAALLPPADVRPRSHLGSAVRRRPGSPGLGAGDRRAGAIEPLRPAPRSHARVVPLPPPVPRDPSRPARASRRPIGSVAPSPGVTVARAEGRPRRRCSTRWPGRRCGERSRARGAVGGRADPRRSPGHGSPLAGRLPGRRPRRSAPLAVTAAWVCALSGEKDRARRYVSVAEGALARAPAPSASRRPRPPWRSSGRCSAGRA